MNLQDVQKIIEAFGPPLAVVAAALLVLYLILKEAFKLLAAREARATADAERHEAVIKSILTEHKSMLEQQREHHREILKADREHDAQINARMIEAINNLRSETACRYPEGRRAGGHMQ